MATSCSIKTRNDSDNDNPLNWCIEVSNTGNKNDWKTIDSRKDVKTVSKRDQSDTFLIGTKLLSNESCRFIRLRCTGYTSYSCGYFANFIPWIFRNILLCKLILFLEFRSWKHQVTTDIILTSLLINVYYSLRSDEMCLFIWSTVFYDEKCLECIDS